MPLSRAWLTLAAATLLLPQSLVAQDTLDVLITGGRIYDGTGAAPRDGAVGIRGNRIAFVGALPRNVVAKRRIDARDQVVTPGFIDPHTHAYEGFPLLDLERRLHLSSLMPGITPVRLDAQGQGPL